MKERIVNNEKIITALLSNYSIEAAAKEIGISSRTIRNRLKKQEFQKEYRNARLQLMEHATAALQAQLDSAVKTLIEIMNDPEGGASGRIKAAEDILNYSLKLTEQLDILPRLEALEKANEAVDNAS